MINLEFERSLYPNMWILNMQQSGITDIFSVDLEEEAKKLLELEDVVSEVENE